MVERFEFSAELEDCHQRHRQRSDAFDEWRAIGLFAFYDPSSFGSNFDRSSQKPGRQFVESVKYRNRQPIGEFSESSMFFR